MMRRIYRTARLAFVVFVPDRFCELLAELFELLCVDGELVAELLAELLLLLCAFVVFVLVVADGRTTVLFVGASLIAALVFDGLITELEFVAGLTVEVVAVGLKLLAGLTVVLVVVGLIPFEFEVVVDADRLFATLVVKEDRAPVVTCGLRPCCRSYSYLFTRLVLCVKSLCGYFCS